MTLAETMQKVERELEQRWAEICDARALELRALGGTEDEIEAAIARSDAQWREDKPRQMLALRCWLMRDGEALH